MKEKPFDAHAKTLSPNLQRMVDQGRGPGTLSDQAGYKSPITREWVEGRHADREHMKKNSVRRVDPTEAKDYGINQGT